MRSTTSAEICKRSAGTIEQGRFDNTSLPGFWETLLQKSRGIFRSLSVIVILGIATVGCSSSDSSQKDSAGNISSDTSSSQLPKSLHVKKSHNQRQSTSGTRQGFVTEEDTIEAQVVTRNGNGHSKAPPKRSGKKKYYSVQIGAFRVLSNADKAQKLVKQRFKKPVYHFYDKAIKMYRVTVGNYSKIKDAFTFLKTVQKHHPKEYKDAWVAEMRR